MPESATQAASETPPAQSTLVETPQVAEMPAGTVRYGEPAGCQEPLADELLADRLAYAEHIYGFAGSLQARWQNRVWNPAAGRMETTGSAVVALSVKDLAPEYRLQELANALFVAGFVPWLRRDEENELHILAVALQPGVMESEWGGYVTAYFGGPLAEPDNDLSVIPMMRLTPCDWMVRQGYAPAVEAGELEMAAWEQPDFTSGAELFLATNTDEAYTIAYMIDWQPEGDKESPTTMCGPLTWSIIANAGALPPGYGPWSLGAKSFWLPDPRENGRPWNLFPGWMYSLEKHATPAELFDFGAHPLYEGDIVYTYALNLGFDHVLTVTEVDPDGGAYTVTNLIQVKPEKSYTIRRVLLYSPIDPRAGIFRNEWSKDLANGLTGQDGFEVFRWKWREKDILGQNAAYTVQPGDTLPLVAARWRTPPEQIAAANGLDPALPLRAGAELVIPPNE